MSHAAKIDLLVLWEDELRKAAKLLDRANNCKEEDEFHHASKLAWAACSIALHGLNDDKTVVLMAHGSLKIKRKTKP